MAKLFCLKLWFWAAFASVQIHKISLAKGNKTLKCVSITLNCISPKICKISNMIGKLTILFFGFCWFMLTASELLFNVIWVILSCSLSSFVDAFWGWRCHKSWHQTWLASTKWQINLHQYRVGLDTRQVFSLLMHVYWFIFTDYIGVSLGWLHKCKVQKKIKKMLG